MKLVDHSPLFVAFLCLSACGNIPSSNAEVAELLDEEAAGFKECIDHWGVDFDKECSIKNRFLQDDIINKGSYKITMIEQIWSEYIKKGDHSFDVLEKLVEEGADILKVSRSIVDLGSLDDFRSLLRIGGGPNSLAGTGLADGTIMHSAIELWENEKVSYLLDQNPDLEQKNSDGETALLVARRSPFQISRIEKMRILIDRGVNVHALDTDGKGLCDFLKQEKKLVRTEFLTEINEFEEFLESKGLACA